MLTFGTNKFWQNFNILTQLKLRFERQHLVVLQKGVGTYSLFGKYMPDKICFYMHNTWCLAHADEPNVCLHFSSNLHKLRQQIKNCVSMCKRNPLNSGPIKVWIEKICGCAFFEYLQEFVVVVFSCCNFFTYFKNDFLFCSCCNTVPQFSMSLLWSLQ